MLERDKRYKFSGFTEIGADCIHDKIICGGGRASAGATNLFIQGDINNPLNTPSRLRTSIFLFAVRPVTLPIVSRRIDVAIFRDIQSDTTPFARLEATLTFPPLAI